MALSSNCLGPCAQFCNSHTFKQVSSLKYCTPLSTCFEKCSFSPAEISFTSRNSVNGLHNFVFEAAVLQGFPEFHSWRSSNERRKNGPSLSLDLIPRKVTKCMAGFGKSGGGPPDIIKRMSSSVSPPGLGQFRPPPLPIPGLSMPAPGRNQDLGDEGKIEKEKRTMELLDTVGAGGTWQERASAIRELQEQMGFTTEALYGATLVSYDKQTAMVVALQVYNSLVSAGTSEDLLSQLRDSEIELLYQLRTLSVSQRKAAAEYMMENGLNMSGVRELAKAIKEHERRPQGREGFTTAPGDCLAFMLHRAAGEAADAEVKESFVQQGLSVVVSETARQRFSEFTNS